MSGLREERAFADALVRGIRVLWWDEVFAKAGIPVGAGLPARRRQDPPPHRG